MSWRQSPEVYTDGACENNGKTNARAGIGVYWGPGDTRNVSEALHGRQTNNRAEIQAAVRAINQAREQGLRQMTIVCDSEFLINSITKWMPTWKQNGWRTVDGERVENRADFDDYNVASDGMQVTLKFVSAHSGNPGNEEADRLAKAGIKKHVI